MGTQVLRHTQGRKRQLCSQRPGGCDEHPDGLHPEHVKRKGEDRREEYKDFKLVAEAFIPNPDLLDYVFHKDGNPENNCVDNLEWVGEQERRRRMRERAFSRGWGRVGTPVRCLDSDYNVVKVYRSMLDAANALGLTQPGISRAVKNMTRCGGFYWTQAMPSEVDK